MPGLGNKADPGVWEEITLITVICLHMQHCMVQATGKSMGMIVLQKRARLLNLSDREKEDIMDMPTV